MYTSFKKNFKFSFSVVRPVIDPFTFPKSLEQGQRYNVLCTVTQGDPPIRIRWMKDGTSNLPPDDPNVRAVTVTPFSSSLVFEALTPDQRGNYTCVAENKAGRDSHTATMVIHGTAFSIEHTHKLVIYYFFFSFIYLYSYCNNLYILSVVKWYTRFPNSRINVDFINCHSIYFIEQWQHSNTY